MNDQRMAEVGRRTADMRRRVDERALYDVT